MKTFKKLLLGAAILFNSCTMIAMDASDAIITELQGTGLDTGRLDEIKDILLKAFDKKGTLKADSLSPDEQAATNLLEAIKSSDEQKSSTFYKNIDAIVKKCANFSNAQMALKNILTQLSQNATQSVRANSRSKLNQDLDKKAKSPSLTTAAITTNTSQPSFDDYTFYLENVFGNGDVFEMINPMYNEKTQTDFTNTRRLDKTPQREESPESAASDTNPLESNTNHITIDQLKNNVLEDDQLDEIKSLLLQAFNKKGTLKSGALSPDEQLAVNLIGAIQSTSEPATNAFYENINKIAKNCSAFKPEQKKLNNIFMKLIDTAPQTSAKRTIGKLDPRLSSINLPIGEISIEKLKQLKEEKNNSDNNSTKENDPLNSFTETDNPDELTEKASRTLMPPRRRPTIKRFTETPPKAAN